MPETKANGVTIHYEDHGNPSDPAMLLIMGFGAQLTLWPDELVEALVAEARATFEALDLVNITAFTADGSRGLEEQAPFDRILVTAAAEDPPGPLLAQLRIGGIMVLPVGQSDAVQTLIRVRRLESGFDYEELRPVRFVPLLEGLGKDSAQGQFRVPYLFYIY